MPSQPGLMFGTSRGIRTVLDQCKRYARVADPILILGEPGTGKSVVAEYIHQLSGRTGRFVKESAANIPAHLERAELQGYIRGAFTGAQQNHTGLIEAANGGTFFLDELGDASLTVQQALRQLIENGTVRRLGEERERPVNVRFIAATNADLKAMVAAGTFRRDLADRFGFFIIRMPTLAERRDEILMLIDFYMQRYTEEVGLCRRPVFSETVRAALLVAPWMGNVRELVNLCRFVIAHADDCDRPVEIENLPPDFVATLGTVLQTRYQSGPTGPLQEPLGPTSLQEALRSTGGDRSAAARLLGISRTHLYRRLRKLGIDPNQV